MAILSTCHLRVMLGKRMLSHVVIKSCKVQIKCRSYNLNTTLYTLYEYSISTVKGEKQFFSISCVCVRGATID